MASKNAVKFRFLPKGIEIDIEKLTLKIKKIIEENEGVYSDKEIEPIAFGLKALIVSFAYPENKDIDELENKFKKIEEVSSCEMIDYRRAVG